MLLSMPWGTTKVGLFGGISFFSSHDGNRMPSNFDARAANSSVIKRAQSIVSRPSDALYNNRAPGLIFLHSLMKVTGNPDSNMMVLLSAIHLRNVFGARFL